MRILTKILSSQTGTFFTVLNNKTIFKTQGQELLKKKKQKTYHKVYKTKKKKRKLDYIHIKNP